MGKGKDGGGGCHGCVHGESRNSDLLVCHCYSVLESTVRSVVAEGAKSVAQVSEICGAGTGCSACVARIERVLRGMPARCGSGRFDLCGDCGCIGALCSCGTSRDEEAAA